MGKPDFNREQAAMARGFAAVCGIDEAGRGPWAGPVVAAAVILDPGNIPAGLNDSKKLNEAEREALFDPIIQSSQVGIGIVSALEIDDIIMGLLCRHLRSYSLAGRTPIPTFSAGLSSAHGTSLFCFKNEKYTMKWMSSYSWSCLAFVF